MEVKIKNNNELIDATIEMVDGVMVVSPKEEKYLPKDGDVVFQDGDYSWVFIYKDNLTSEAYYYIARGVKNGTLSYPDGGHIGYKNTLRPATEEEKKVFFDRLAKEGLTWDSEKKELVKLKWKPKEKDVCFAPAFRNSMNFVVENLFWYDCDVFEEIYNSGCLFKSESECQAFVDKLNQAISQVKP